MDEKPGIWESIGDSLTALVALPGQVFKSVGATVEAVPKAAQSAADTAAAFQAGVDRLLKWLPWLILVLIALFFFVGLGWMKGIL